MKKNYLILIITITLLLITGCTTKPTYIITQTNTINNITNNQTLNTTFLNISGLSLS